MKDLDYLIEQYFNSKDDFSTETSSHWRKYGANQKIIRTNKNLSHRQSRKQRREVNSLDKLEITGEGFGDFKRLNFLNLIAHIPVFLYLLLNFYHKLQWSTFIQTLKYSVKSKQIFGYDLTRMALTIEYLEKNIDNLNQKSFCIIGDGYGRLGTLLKMKFPNCQITSINLGRTLLFDYYYTFKVFPRLTHCLINQGDELHNDFNYIEAEKYHKYVIKSDVWINIASMQEMNYEQINQYFSLIKNQETGALFYCANRISKKLPDESVINYYSYPWSDLEIITDELCPWHQEFPSVKPPFVRKFDGPLQHRLVRVKNSNMV